MSRVRKTLKRTATALGGSRGAARVGRDPDDDICVPTLVSNEEAILNTQEAFHGSVCDGHENRRNVWASAADPVGRLLRGCRCTVARICVARFDRRRCRAEYSSVLVHGVIASGGLEGSRQIKDLPER